jgi:S1-C subfamily serine protease
VVPLPQALRDQLGGQETGLIVLSLVSGGPAENGGLLIGDVLVGLEGQQLSDAEDLQSQLTPERVGKPAQLRVVRGGELRDVTITLGQRD